MIFDILSRVPFKSMCRFGCVSAIISDPNFMACGMWPRGKSCPVRFSCRAKILAKASTYRCMI
jgi:hypothetical protein